MALSKTEKRSPVLRDPVTFYQKGQNLRGKAVVIMIDSAGVGLETAIQLAGYAAPVFLAARNITELKRALAAINQAGGEGDGMVVDMSRADEWRRFFLLAEGWLGRIDVVVNPLSFGEWTAAQSPQVQSRDLKAANIKSAARSSARASQNLCMKEAIHRMRARGYGHILNIYFGGYRRSENSLEQRAAADLRRQAGELGIRVTVIEPGMGQSSAGGSKPARLVQPTVPAVEDISSAQDIARCVIDSLLQPFGVDVMALTEKPQAQPGL